MSTTEDFFVMGIDENLIHLKAADGRSFDLKTTELTASQKNAFDIAMASDVTNWDGKGPAPIVIHAIVEKAADGQYQSIQIASIEVRNS